MISKSFIAKVISPKALEQTDVLVLLVDLDDQDSYVNHLFLRCSGYQYHAMIDEPCRIVEPDNDSPPYGTSETEQFHKTYGFQELAAQYLDELNIIMVPLAECHFNSDKNQLLPVPESVQQNLENVAYSARQLRESLRHGGEPPCWYSYLDIIAMLKKFYPAHSKVGFTLFYTGLSGSEISALTKIIYTKLIGEGVRPVALLDDDVERVDLSSELRFSKEYRDHNICRVCLIANEITKNGGIAICTPISPCTKTCRTVRESIKQHGDFIEIQVVTTPDICETRGRKGLYTMVRKGLIPKFTGISVPYEPPEQHKLGIDTPNHSPMEAIPEIYLYLLRDGYSDGGYWI